jgi:predicted RNA-binding Zn-ribbon protein involved in translation (DUF1610 family)
MSIALAQCRHFTGIDKKACSAGVAYVLVRGRPGPKSPFGHEWPCMATGQHLDCDARSMPTSEEIALARAETEAMFAAIEAGTCPDCGAKLARVSTHRDVVVDACPNCPDVSVRSCRVRGAG